ncbi:leucyl aminopeptidase family protein [Kribbella sp. NPDC048928]|uniref:leucyl aminopeptidase family protein n=1 Tax=Kribbella sp. NPDC048928 TaxID=3364111 RepID=UPI00371F7DAD
MARFAAVVVGPEAPVSADIGPLVVAAGPDGALIVPPGTELGPGWSSIKQTVGRVRFPTGRSTVTVPCLDGAELLVVRWDDADRRTTDAARRAGMVAGSAWWRSESATVCLPWQLGFTTEQSTALVEGWILGGYRYGDPPGDELVRFAGPDADAVRAGVALGESTNLARELIDTPPGQLTPAALAETCRQLGATYGFDVRVLEQDVLLDGGFGGLVGVGAGSPQPPVLIELRLGDAGARHTAIVAKGITFDAGGLSLKSTREMLTMKADMAAAGAVIGAFVALSRLQAAIPLRAYLACAENLPGPGAVRIGDVLTHRGGRTVEVTDADCEGRLVVADALAYALEAGPDAVIDLATLSSTSGLGPDIWAGFATDDDLVDGLVAAGAQAGEPGWRMPLWEPYRAGLRSNVADLRNFDSGATQLYGAITAALYLREFVGEVPWAHIDLGLTVMKPGDDECTTAGANGRGARTLTRYFLNAIGRTV